MNRTPGPWKVNDINPFEVYSPTRRIADCRPPGCICHTAEDRANAVIISAAPELLEALQLLVATFSKCSVPAQGGPDPFTWLYQKEFSIAAAAISKATGQ